MVGHSIDINAATRGFLLRMGDSWLEQKELRQSADVYFKIIEQYPDSEESKTAQSRLLTIFKSYELEGQMRTALDVLERLEESITANGI